MSEEEKKYVDEDEIDLLDLIAVLLRYRWFIIIITGLAALGVVGYSLISIKLPPEKSPMPNQYTTEALLLINDSGAGGVSAAISGSGLGDLASLAGVSGGGGGSNVALAEKLITSRKVLDTLAKEFNIVERYDIQEAPRANSRQIIKSYLQFERDSSTGTVTLSAESTKPEFATKVLNRAVELLEKRFESIGVDKTRTKKKLLEGKIAEVEKKIKELESQVKEFQNKYGIMSVSQLTSSGGGSGGTNTLSMLSNFRSKLIMKKMEIETYSKFSRVNDPVLQRLKAERDNLKEIIENLESKGGSEKYGTSSMISQKEIPEVVMDFRQLERELNVQSTIYESLRKELELAKLNMEGSTPVFQVLEHAEVPEKKSGPSRSTLCMIVTIAAFFLSVFGAFVLNAIRNIKNDPERMSKLKSNL